MYKLKYYSLSKEEKELLKEEYYKTDKGISNKTRLNRLFILGILGICFSIYLYISHTTIWDIVTASLLLIASLIFIIGSFKIKIRNLNNYLIKKK